MIWQDDIAVQDDGWDEGFGERFDLTPRRAGVNASSMADPDRPSFCFVGIFYDDDNMHSGAPQLERRSTTPSVSVQVSNLKHPPKRQDRLTRLCSGKVFEINDIAEETDTRLLLHLTEMGRGPKR